VANAEAMSLGDSLATRNFAKKDTIKMRICKRFMAVWLRMRWLSLRLLVPFFFPAFRPLNVRADYSLSFFLSSVTRIKVKQKSDDEKELKDRSSMKNSQVCSSDYFYLY
jgi:hypothetical protein